MIRRTLALLVAAALPAWGAMDFDGATGKAQSGTAEVTAAPLSVACWFRTDDNAANQNIISIADTGSGTNYFTLHYAGAGSDKIAANTRDNSANAFAITTGTLADTAWHHAAGVFASAASRTVYFDGTDTANETTSVTPSGIDATAIGVLTNSAPSNFLNGAAAECGIWNVALTAADIAVLAKGFPPPCRRRDALVAYYPMVRDATSLKDLFSGTANHLTLTGGTVSAHPPMIRCQ